MGLFPHFKTHTFPKTHLQALNHFWDQENRCRWHPHLLARKRSTGPGAFAWRCLWSSSCQRKKTVFSSDLFIKYDVIQVFNSFTLGCSRVVSCQCSFPPLLSDHCTNFVHSFAHCDSFVRFVDLSKSFTVYFFGRYCRLLRCAFNSFGSKSGLYCSLTNTMDSRIVIDQSPDADWKQTLQWLLRSECSQRRKVLQ